MVTRRIARPLLASVFIAGGIDQLRRPGDKAEVAAPVLDAVHEAAAPTLERADVAPDGLPVDLADGRADLLADETLVRINGAVQVGAGLLLASNRMPRVAATALAATLVPTTLGGHRWWEEEGVDREIQRFNFLKNVALLGGLVLAASDTEGAPGLAWRLRRANREGKLAARAAVANAAVAAHAAALDAKAAKRLAKVNAKVAGKGGELAVAAAAGRAAELAPKVQELGHSAQAVGHALADRAVEVAAEVAPKVQAAAQRATAALPTSA